VKLLSKKKNKKKKKLREIFTLWPMTNYCKKKIECIEFSLIDTDNITII